MPIYLPGFVFQSSWAIRWYSGNPPPAATRRTALATRYPLPTTHPGTPNFSVPDLAPADNKIQNDRQKKHTPER